MNKMRNLIPALLGLLALAALTGCGGTEPSPTDSPTQAPTPQPVETDSPLPTPQPIETDTPMPTPLPPETPQPTATPLPFPEPQPYPTPEWAPYEGKPFTIVFQRCGELWLSEVGGQGERPLTNEGMGTSERPCLGVSSFAVSPDGQSIAYIVRDEDHDFVKVVDVLDGSTRIVGSTSEPYRVFIFGQPAWWDDAHIAHYVSEPPPIKEDDTTQMKNLVIVDLETGESTVEPFSAFQYPSAGGRYVLSGHNFRGLDPDYLPYQLSDRETEEQWRVTDEDIPARFLGWSPEGRLMLFSLTYEREVLSVLLIVNAETRARWVITPEGKTVDDSCAAWSPDGQAIAYRQCDPPRTACMNSELWLASPDGANRRRIPMEEPIHCTQISWTPEGSRLVFETTLEPRIWSVRLDGTDLRPIAHGQNPQVLLAPKFLERSQVQVICRIRQQ